MTDEQWLWAYINEAIDYDIKLEGMCPSCRVEATSNKKCTRCGKPINNMDSFVNPNFDIDRWNALANGTHDEQCDHEHD